jgi:probable addiction module antidote protein
MARSKKYHDWLIEKLKNHDDAVSYLNEALEDSLKGTEKSRYLFLIALRNVAEAQGGMSKLAKKSHIGRESLYKTLSEKGNPKWATLITLIDSLGLSLRLVG